MYVQHDEEEGELPFYRYLKIVAALCCIFSIAILIDYVLPAVCKSETVAKRNFIKESSRFGGTDYDLKLITQTFEIKASPDLFDDAKENTNIQVCYSPVFKSVRTVSGNKNNTGKVFSHDLTPKVYKGFGAFPIALLLLGIATLFFKDDTISYGAGILSVVVLVTMLIIL